MKNLYKIIVDAAGDFFPTTLKQEDVLVIPMEISINENILSYSPDTPEEEIVEFYKELSSGSQPTTTQITSYYYQEFFRPYLEEGQDILYLCLDSAITSMNDQALLASQILLKEFPDRKIKVIDSLCAAGGIGLLLEIAVEQRRLGKSLDENAAFLEDKKLTVSHLFVVDDLYHLQRGGRLSKMSAIVGSSLNIKPILHISNDGRLIPIMKSRGFKQSYRDILKGFEQRSKENISSDEIMICHANSLDKAHTLEELLMKKYNLDPVTKQLLSPVIGAHVGSNMVALVFRGKR